MKKKFVRVMLFGALTLTVSTVVTSCKDYDDDIKGMLEFYQIDPTEENIMKIATPEFVRSFHDRLVEYGNEMIADKVREVFDV